ncbi:MAG: hypothetical protein GF315_06660 [candidate division Zixibacteria bacterium]|nr:hypothetical protein [candidate division Zixibacteria bacterium]
MIPNETKFGQLFVFGFAGKTVPDYIEALIAEDNLGGLILFARNGETPEAVRDITDRIPDKSPLRPLVFIDQEGGNVSRIRFDSFIDSSAKELSEKDDLDFFRQLTVKRAKALIECGIDVNTVPVLDMPSHPDISVLEGRCFGNSPDKVIKFASVIYDAYRETNLLCCAKHFPGLGDTVVDPHFDLPMDNSPVERYLRHKLLPFKSAIDQGVPMIMTTHILCAALDSNSPVTFSRKVVTEILKGEMGFSGMVVSDDLEMGAMLRYYDWDSVILNSIKAGHHFQLVCHSKDRQLDALRLVKEEMEKDSMFAKQVRKTVAEIEKFKMDYSEGKQDGIR